LLQHLTWVADLAARHGRSLNAEDECRFAAILHDLGKYGVRFQARLHRGESHIDHWSAGAFEAAMAGPRGFASALAIQGHHIGLQRGDRNSLGALNIADLLRSHPLGCRLSDDDHQAITDRARTDGFSWVAPAESCFDWAIRLLDPVGQMLAVRMLFSALVDADYIATERHFGGLATSGQRRDAVALNAAAAHASLLSHIAGVVEQSTSASEVNRVRRALLETCLQSGRGPQGLFTLNAPTGSGKTLAMLAWALEHCLAHRHLCRIIVVLPYLTIIEQTARVYRDSLAAWLPEEMHSRGILEHHTLASWKSVPFTSQPSDEQEPNGGHPRFLAENWDAPIVITSTVQFFESLFANNPSACRKLHRIANSVILLDEVQTLRPSLILPTLGALSSLVRRFRCSAILATATQPAFSHLSTKVQGLATAGYSAQPIVSDPAPFFSRMRRNRVHWPANGETTAWDEIARRMIDGGQALCIVNLKRHAQSLFDLLRQRRADGVLHLSTLMCPGHREAVLKEVRARLADDLPCLLVATQCVEAGVDLDFPMVLRSFGPLDSIAQAAGRCNRNGKRESGDAWVFHPDDSGRRYPDGTYEQAAMVTAELLTRRGGTLDIDDPAVFIEYFQSLYDLSRPESRSRDLLDAIHSLNFLKVAELYKIIDENSISIVTPWSIEQFTKLAAEVRAGRLTRSWIQRVRVLTVNVFRPQPGSSDRTHLEPVPLGRGKIAEDWFLLKDPGDYDPSVGLRFQKGLAFTEG
jgi:CRISPR-associated helicase Cas3/CRISPR-associated endonuclease Cas3-HD